MNKQDNTEIDYEIMDDLPITEHFEWHFFQIDAATAADNQNEWQVT